MSEEKRVRMRLLPGGEFREGMEAGWKGRLMDIDFLDPSAAGGWNAGAPVEVEAGAKLYLGVLRERDATGVSVLVEHSLDRSQMDWIQEVWG
jgi:hypothetical protein